MAGHETKSPGVERLSRTDHVRASCYSDNACRFATFAAKEVAACADYLEKLHVDADLIHK